MANLSVITGACISDGIRDDKKELLVKENDYLKSKNHTVRIFEDNRVVASGKDEEEYMKSKEHATELVKGVDQDDFVIVEKIFRMNGFEEYDLDKVVNDEKCDGYAIKHVIFRDDDIMFGITPSGSCICKGENIDEQEVESYREDIQEVSERLSRGEIDIPVGYLKNIGLNKNYREIEQDLDNSYLEKKQGAYTDGDSVVDIIEKDGNVGLRISSLYPSSVDDTINELFRDIGIRSPPKDFKLLASQVEHLSLDSYS